MLYAVEQPQFHRIRPLFPEPHLSLMTEAMIAGNSPARMWVDDANAPRSVYIWDRGHCHYLAGAADNDEFNDNVRRLIAATIAPDVLARGLRFFKVYRTTAAWDKAITAIYPEVALKRRARVFLGLDHLRLPDWRNHEPTGFSVQRIKRELLTQPALKNVQWLAEEIESCWPTVDAFFARAFGFYACSADAVAGWCTGEYVSGRQIGIGIATVQEYQKRGLATLMACAFAEHALAQGMTPHWDAFADNLPSLRVAEKAGFMPRTEYTVHTGMLGT